MRQRIGTFSTVPSARGDLGGHHLARLDGRRGPVIVDRLVALEAKRLPVRAILEHERHDAHADQVRAVDALERLGDHGACTPSRLVPFAAQSRDEPLPYSTPAKTTSGTPSAL